MYWDMNNLHGLSMSQQVSPVGGFKWVGNTSQFNNDFIKNYNEHSNRGYFLEEL